MKWGDVALIHSKSRYISSPRHNNTVVTRSPNYVQQRMYAAVVHINIYTSIHMYVVLQQYDLMYSNTRSGQDAGSSLRGYLLRGDERSREESLCKV